MSDDYTFESTDAGASDTFPCEAGQIRKGGFIMIKGHPCKVRRSSAAAVMQPLVRVCAA